MTDTERIEVTSERTRARRATSLRCLATDGTCTIAYAECPLTGRALRSGRRCPYVEKGE